MAVISNLLQFYHGGQDQDDAPIRIAPGDYVAGFNIRASGTTSGEDGYITNIESNILIAGNLPPGINKIVGCFGFEQIRKGIWYIYNSEGYHQIGSLDYDTNTLTIVFENLTDTAGVDVLFLTANNYVDDIKLINDDYLIWNDANADVGYTNLTTLSNGGYRTLLPEDFSLLKPQILPPPTGTYGSDDGQPANFLFGNLPQFTVQGVNADYNYTAWSTWSKRIVPYQQDTPVLGSDVTQNNYIIVSVNIGSIRLTTINVACRFGTFDFAIIKSADRAYITALPHTAVDVSTEVYEAYNPATNIYSFAFYNNEISIPVNPLETDLFYDYIWPCGATEVVNGDIIANGDIKADYQRPTTAVTLAGIGYNPNIAIPAGTYPDPLRKTGQFPGESGSGAGSHKRIMSVSMGGTPHTGDIIIVTVADIRNANSIITMTYTVPSGLDGNLAGVVAAISGSINTTIGPSSYVLNGDGTYTITFVGPSYFGLQNYAIELFFAGASVANSIPSMLDNSTYQAAISYRDSFGRPFPLCTSNSFVIPTPSYAQVNGNAIELAWTIQNAVAPVGAVDYQWLLTKPPVTQLVDTVATLLNYKSTWNAATNTPTLAVNVGTVGDTYQITVPASPAIPASYHDLGGTQTYPTGGYVVYNGQSWDVLPKDFGDLTATGNILAFSLQPLVLFNSEYATQGISTILGYDYAVGDRCTLHYYIDGSGNKVFINNPCVNLSVFGYDSSVGIVKVEKSATFNTSVLSGVNTFLRLYSPALLDQSASAVQNGTVFYEIGDRHTITNGMHDVLTGTITDGGVYYKTRQFPDGLLPYTNPPVEVLATDLNYSDFYQSAFGSFGRPRSYNDELEQTERKAVITWSESYVLGSKRNGLTRVYPENVYGTLGGQTSANFGAIRKMLQVNNELVVIQELNHGSIPVWQTVYVDQLQKTTVAVSEKLFNPIRYTTSKHIGIGNAKESVAIYNNVIYWIDPNRSQPVRWEGDGCFPISLKMSKYFKTTLQAAFAQGYKIIGWYDIFNDEYVISIQQPGGIISTFKFDSADWIYLEQYTVAPGGITVSTPPAHATTSYNSTTGNLTITPSTNYVGADSLIIAFTVNSVLVYKNACLSWTAGSGTVNPFAFVALLGVPLSTVETSNSILVSGNDFPVAVSITGGQYSINGGAWTSLAGTVNNGDSVQVRQTSSGSNSTLTTATLTIDSQSAAFNVTTRATGNFTVSAQYGLTFESVTNSTSTGVPGSLAIISVPPGSSLAVAYTSVTAGNIVFTVSGTPSKPGHVKVSCYVNGVFVSSIPVTMPGSYGLSISNSTDPTPILIAVETY